MKVPLAMLALCVSLQAAEPLGFQEISFLVRMREPDAEIMRQLSNRHLLRPLTSDQETMLKSQGASDALLQSMRAPQLVVSEAEADALELRRRQMKEAPAVATPEEEAKPKPAGLTKDAFQIAKVAYGQSVNLSRWGGSSTDIKFFRKGGEVVAVSGKPAFIDPFARAHETATYDRVDPLSFYAANQIIAIDRNNRLIVPGLPILYWVYDAGAASLYFASENLEGVTIAVRVAER